MKNIRQRTLGFILMGIGFVLTAGGVYEVAQTDEFRSATRIKLVVPDCGCITEKGAGHKDHHAEFFQAETKAILSDSILSNVVYRLELRDKWDKKFANEDNLPAERGWKYFTKGKIKTAEIVGLLRDRLEVIRVPNTPFLDIVFVSNDADETALIANMVSAVYLDWRTEKGRRLAQGRIEALKAQIEIEDEKIKTSKEELQRLRKELNISDAEVESAGVRTNFPKYWNAKMHLKRLNDLREMITRKKDFEEADLRLPYNSPVDVMEVSVPSKTPVRHHRPLGAMLALIGVALFGYGLASVWKSKPLNAHKSPA